MLNKKHPPTQNININNKKKKKKPNKQEKHPKQQLNQKTKTTKLSISLANIHCGTKETFSFQIRYSEFRTILQIN